MMRKSFALELQEHPLKNVSAVTCETSNTSNTEIALNYQNIYGNSKMLIYYQLLNGVLLQKYCQKRKQFLLRYVSLRNSK